jgi:hypothetical protein
MFPENEIRVHSNSPGKQSSKCETKGKHFFVISPFQAEPTKEPMRRGQI